MLHLRVAITVCGDWLGLSFSTRPRERSSINRDKNSTEVNVREISERVRNCYNSVRLWIIICTNILIKLTATERGQNKSRSTLWGVSKRKAAGLSWTRAKPKENMRWMHFCGLRIKVSWSALKHMCGVARGLNFDDFNYFSHLVLIINPLLSRGQLQTKTRTQSIISFATFRITIIQLIPLRFLVLRPESEPMH